nr:hypothetical protein GCM10020093_045100 [Planobispora longispora]
MLSPAEQEAMPHVLGAWARFAARRTGLAEEGLRATLDGVWEATGKFAETYRDPTTFGLDRRLVERLLPDGDLSALARRVFAFPFLQGMHGEIKLDLLNPPTRPTAGSCWRSTTRTTATGSTTTSTWPGTRRSPRGCGRATRRSCGRPPSGCWTSGTTGTRCSTC